MKALSLALPVGLFSAACAYASPGCGGVSPSFIYSATASSEPEARGRALLDRASIPELECWMRRGDRPAAYALGVAYEHGVGVNANLRAAYRYYLFASSDVVEERSFHMAPVGGQNYTVPLRVPMRRRGSGLPEARQAVARLQALLSGADRPGD